MATEYIQDLAFQQLSHAIMATANSMAASASGGGSGSEGGDSLFDVMRRKLSKVSAEHGKRMEVQVGQTFKKVLFDFFA